MRTIAGLLIGSSLCLAGLWVIAQEEKPAKPEAPTENVAAIDAVSEEAAKLEAELGKLRETAPEAAELMVKLVDLYHQHGRVFGLIAVGQRFVARHTDHPAHRAVMLKTIDGLVAATRNKDTIVACRQFLARNEQDAERPRLELLLARTIEQSGAMPEAAEAYEAYWKRNPQAADAVSMGLRASDLNAARNDVPGRLKAAQIREAIYDTLPAAQALEVGWYSFEGYRGLGDAARTNVMGNKLLKKTPPADPARLRYIHEQMAAYYNQLGQYANAVQSYKAARALEDSEALHRLMVLAMYNSGAKGAELEPVINEYMTKFPQLPSRFELKSYLVPAYLRDANRDRAMALIGELLPVNAMTHNLASLYLGNMPNDEANNKAAEAVLIAAIAQNKPHSSFLRYVLALPLYRDRLKDIPKARAVLKQMVAEEPGNDGYTVEGIKFLLYSAPNDAEFNVDVDAILAARLKYVERATLRGVLPAWITEATANADHKARAAATAPKVAAQDNLPLFKDWGIHERGTSENPVQEARERLAKLDLSEAQFEIINGALVYNYRNFLDAAWRAKASPVYSRMAAKYPARWDIAQAWLETASDYAPEDQRKLASQHMLKQEAPSRVPDTWRRLMMVSLALKDADLARQSYAWIEKNRQKYGSDNYTAETIGDTLNAFDLKAEALAWWTMGFTTNRDASYSRTCADRLAALKPEGPERLAFWQQAAQAVCDYHGAYSMIVADAQLKAKDLAGFEKTMRASRALQDGRPYRGWGIEEPMVLAWVDAYRTSTEATEADKNLVFGVVRDLKMGRASVAAQLSLFELPGGEPAGAMPRLVAWQSVTNDLGNDPLDWDRLFLHAQAAMSRKDYQASATLLTAMVSNVPNIDPARLKAGRDLVGLAYSRLGAVGLAIDESSVLAPLLQAALYLRLGDDRMAYDLYTANKELFDVNRNDVPVDLILFVCEHLIAAGGDPNHEKAEDVLRGWIVAKNDVPGVEDRTKARVQLLLAKNFYKARRYEVARTEYTTVINRFPDTPEAVEAQFGIGETFMEQKVYDQAEAVFERLTSSKDYDIVIRAEFLRGVLASRRDDHEEARKIFRNVLERVPSIELANEVLYNLSEIYGHEQRFIDQLELLRTVGRLGRESKRFHAPGNDLSIVVQDPDLGVSQGDSRIPVQVTTVPGGDKETVYLLSGGAGKGLFRADVPTQLGAAVAGDKMLQLTGNDTIKVDYPEIFKKDFRTVMITNSEILIAASATFDVASSKIKDAEAESFSKQIQREELEKELDQRRSATRPENQIKPGSLVHLRVKDADRDLSNEADKVQVKLAATSGDQAQILLLETGPHTGVFEGTAQTAELPAGALASDTSIDHSPLMAIDQNPRTTWRSEPDGAAPKWLTVDMKELKVVDRVTFTSPDPKAGAPVRGELLGSHDGQFFFRLATVPPQAPAAPVEGESGRMTQRIFAGNYTGYTTWDQVVAMSKGTKPVEQLESETLAWKREVDAADKAQPFAALWHGKLMQYRTGAARLRVQGVVTALVLDGELLLAPKNGAQMVDVWLTKGTHDLTIFAAMATGEQGVSADIARADYNSSQVAFKPFNLEDFDLTRTGVQEAEKLDRAKVLAADGIWNFQFPSMELRHVKLLIQEYLGESVAISQVEIKGDDGSVTHIPTEADVLSLAQNDVLEIAAGDLVAASYTDEFTQTLTGRSRLLSSNLQATYFNGSVTPIVYDFHKATNGEVYEVRKDLLRIEPGDRFIIEVTDYDQDSSDQPDSLNFQIVVNDNDPIELVAQETLPFSGVFTKEVDTSMDGKPGTIKVAAGDRVYCTYLDPQNTFPGHAVPRETAVLVNEPSEGRVRIVESRMIPRTVGTITTMETRFLPPNPSPDHVGGVAFGIPLTVEVIDRDAAKDSGSKVVVTLTTSDGAKIDVNCVLSNLLGTTTTVNYGNASTVQALHDGRFIGQVILQLGTANSPDLIPKTTEMAASLIGGPVLTDEEAGGNLQNAIVTRVLNVVGKDIITATYADKLRPDKKAVSLTSKARLIANGQLACTDREYEKSIDRLHVGEKLFLRVSDADRDTSDERDTVNVLITSERGEKETLALSETLAHSGVFTGSVTLKAVDKPSEGNVDQADPTIETFFGDNLVVAYTDETASTEDGKLEMSIELPVVVGTDGLVAAFSKAFNDETLAVETQFRIAESYFELFKSHRKLARDTEQKGDLEAGRRVLREVIEDYPDPKYAPRITYLLGQFSQELSQWDEAIAAYQTISRQYSEHPLAPDAQYKLAQCYEEKGNFNEALEAYVTLAATYPQSPLISQVMIRICDRFYKNENYEVAAQVGEKFAERFDGHQYATRMAFRVGQCHYKAKQYGKAADSFDGFFKKYPDDELASQALFWSGESFRLASSNLNAFRRYNECRWKFPASDAAKYARGRLALPSMLQLFEQEANAVEQDQ